MENRLATVELLGKVWFVDDRLREFRSDVNVGEAIVFFSNQEMDDMLSIKEIIDDHVNFEINGEILSKLRRLFDDAMKGDRKAIKEISDICNKDK